MNYSSFLLQNPWRTGDFNINSVDREILPSIVKDMDSNSVSVIIGSRQVGKTTIIMNIIYDLLNRGIDSKSIFYFNLDDFNLHSYFEKYTDFIQFIDSEYKGYKYIFIDEVQRLKNPGIFLKLIVDLKIKIKIVVSGSSSLELKSKISEHLTGRKHIFEVFPFSFKEFLAVKKNSIFDEKKVIDLIKFHSEEFQALLNEFILYGGYPRVVLADSNENKLIELKEIYDSYIKKDVKDFLKVENINGYNNLIRGMALQIGNLMNYNELSIYSGLNVQTVKKYIDYLEGTYIFKRVMPFFNNARKEISKSPKIFAYDTGLMNYTNDNLFGNKNILGSMYENFVFSEFTKKGFEIKFWRTGGGAEVDFIINNIPIEVKASKLKKVSLTKSFISYLKTYMPQKAFYFNLTLYDRRLFNDTDIVFYPLWLVPKITEEFKNK